MSMELSPIIKVSKKSPYRKCTNGGPGINYPNTETEPYLAVNPSTVNDKKCVNLIGVWQQDRWGNGGAKGLVAVSSLDSGETWKEVPLPFSQCADPDLPFNRASDPWVTFGPDGTAYVSALLINVGADGITVTRSGIATATSSDGGETWENVSIIKQDHEGVINDKETITADPTHPGTAYVVWDQIQSGGASSITYFSKTTDYGKTWSTPKVILNPGPGNGTIGNQIVIDPNTDTLYNFFKLTSNAAPVDSNSDNARGFVELQISTDQGDTWSYPIVISTYDSVGVVDPHTKAPIRSGGDVIPEPAIDKETGELYVVWQDSRFNGGQYDEVALSSSKDGGRTWRAPIRVNEPTGKPAFTPMVQVNSEGDVGVSYFDLREENPTYATVPVNYWFALSEDNGRTFDEEVKLAGPFNILLAPQSNPPFVPGYFIGDYMGLTNVRSMFVSLFIQTNPNFKNRTSAYLRVIYPC